MDHPNKLLIYNLVPEKEINKKEIIKIKSAFILYIFLLAIRETIERRQSITIAPLDIVLYPINKAFRIAFKKKKSPIFLYFSFVFTKKIIFK